MGSVDRFGAARSVLLRRLNVCSTSMASPLPLPPFGGCASCTLSTVRQSLPDLGGLARGRLRGKQPKLKPNQAKHLLELHDSGNYTQGELAELFGVGRSTVYRTIDGCDLTP
jgi:hypothetical protein